MCDNLFVSVGVQYSPEEFAQLRTVLYSQLQEAYRTSSRSNIVISFRAPFGSALNYRANVESVTIAGAYDGWVGNREGSLFGIEPDARVSALAGETAEARPHHPIGGERESLDVRVIERDVFATLDGIPCDYQRIVASELAPDFRTTQQLRGLFELAAAHCLAPGGRLLFNTFAPREGYVPDDAARELGQQCNTMIFTCYLAVSPFMRGYDPTAIPDHDADQETLARDPLALIEALGARDAAVIGHDWGASAAYGAAALDPDQVKKLLVIGIPHPGALKPSLKKLWGVRHFCGIQAARGAETLCAQ